MLPIKRGELLFIQGLGKKLGAWQKDQIVNDNLDVYRVVHIPVHSS
jgi:hypothetical protein